MGRKFGWPGQKGWCVIKNRETIRLFQELQLDILVVQFAAWSLYPLLVKPHVYGKIPDDRHPACNVNMRQ
jgi:hypothetical protein